jgi:hypothetical protein
LNQLPRYDKPVATVIPFSTEDYKRLSFESFNTGLDRLDNAHACVLHQEQARDIEVFSG